MTRQEAKEIAKTITNDQLEDMFTEVMAHYSDNDMWGDTARVNKGITKGTAWNIFAKDFDPEKKYSNIAIFNMIREFGDMLPHNIRISNPPKGRVNINVVHQEPNFDKWV